MKYYIYAKILGTFLPTKSLTINDCKIKKGYPNEHKPYDRPEIPVRDDGMMHHTLSHGVTSFIYYPQKPLGLRTFESDYTLTTTINAYDISRAVESAKSKFEEVVAVLSLNLKTTVRKIGSKRVKRDDENYDFEIVAAYIKHKKSYTRVKLPEPLVNGHNFFPVTPPKGFTNKAKKILDCKDPIFWKALLYIHKNTKLRDSGYFDELMVTLNFVKCIELITKTVITAEKNAKGKNMYMKERMELAGKLLGVSKQKVKYAQEAWDVRNDSDIAHAKGHRSGKFPNFFYNQAAANEFLIKYYNYVITNPALYYMGHGRDWRNLI